MPIVRIRFFSVLKDYTGTNEAELELEEGARARDAVEKLMEEYPGLRRAMEDLGRRGLRPVVLLNGRPARGDEELRDGDELALIPPASGGAVGALVEGEVSLDREAREIARATAGRGAGALVVFMGYVKGSVDGAEVRELVYEAYEPYASQKLREIAEKHEERPGVLEVRIYHRVGALKPGEPTVYILVSATDRHTAFKTASEVLEEVKHEVPIFKLEKRSDGEYWVLGDGERVPKKEALAGAGQR